jgi:MarR family transcriptional regulator, organic hydroperoxide resistance regulator
VSRIQQEIKQTRPFPTRSDEAAVALMRTADMIRRAVAAVVEPAGITPQQYNVLRILRGAADAGLPTLEIAERMIEETPGITRLIDRLETKGLVSRERCATDRRQVFCRITAAGLDLLERLDEPIRQADTEALQSLGNHDLEQLIALLDKTRNAFRRI